MDNLAYLLQLLRKYLFFKDISKIYEQCVEVWDNAMRQEEEARVAATGIVHQ